MLNLCNTTLNDSLLYLCFTAQGFSYANQSASMPYLCRPARLFAHATHCLSPLHLCKSAPRNALPLEASPMPSFSLLNFAFPLHRFIALCFAFAKLCVSLLNSAYAKLRRTLPSLCGTQLSFTLAVPRLSARYQASRYLRITAPYPTLLSIAFAFYCHNEPSFSRISPLTHSSKFTVFKAFHNHRFKIIFK